MELTVKGERDEGMDRGVQEKEMGDSFQVLPRVALAHHS
jgi:hypothetical protein